MRSKLLSSTRASLSSPPPVGRIATVRPAARAGGELFGRQRDDDVGLRSVSASDNAAVLAAPVLDEPRRSCRWRTPSAAPSRSGGR
jgi:hypothetical protein